MILGDHRCEWLELLGSGDGRLRELALMRVPLTREPASEDELQRTLLLRCSDVADEDAFRAAEAGGGIAIKVAEGDVCAGTTAATWSVPQPQVATLLCTFLRDG